MNVELKKWTLEEEDQEALQYISNKVDRKYLSNRLPYPYTREDASWWINFTQKEEGRNGVFRAIVVDGKYVGNISVEKKEDVYCKDAEIGYLLLTEDWSKGIMTEAVKQICEMAFEALDIIRITGLVDDENMASRRVLEKNGFVLEGIMKQAVYKDGNIYNLCVYGKYLKD